MDFPGVSDSRFDVLASLLLCFSAVASCFHRNLKDSYLLTEARPSKKMAKTEASQDRCVRFQVGYSSDLSCIARFTGGKAISAKDNGNSPVEPELKF